MYSSRIRLPIEQTAVIVIDPQAGFCSPSGTLAMVFGTHELAPMQTAIREINRFLTTLPHKARVVIVRSKYPIGLHTDGVDREPLSRLCVAGTPDCELAEDLTLRPGWTFIDKEAPDVWTAAAFRQLVRHLVGRGGKYMVITGLTVTTCILNSVLSLRRAYGPDTLTLVVAQDLVGARSSSYVPRDHGPSRVDDAFRKMLKHDVRVLPTWRNLDLVSV